MRVLIASAALLAAAVLTADGQPRGAPAFDRFRRMSPRERKRALPDLPPERARQIEDRMADLDGMPPEQRARLDKQYQWFQQLPPPRKAAMRKAFQRFNELPAERRRAVYREFQTLRALNHSEQDRRLASGDYRSRFSADERKLLMELAEVEQAPGVRRNVVSPPGR